MDGGCIRRNWGDSSDWYYSDYGEDAGSELRIATFAP
jgi:hypothetical protein